MPSLLTPNPRTPHGRTHDIRSASPSYFGLAVDPDNTTVQSASVRGLKPFSPQSASIRSVAATPPSNFPLPSNPDFEAFRKQTEENAINLNQGGVAQFTSPQLARQYSRPMVSRTASRQNPLSPKPVMPPRLSQQMDKQGRDDLTRPSKSPKRMLSSDSQILLDDRPRRESPASFLEREESSSNGSPPSKTEERQSRSTMPVEFNLNLPPKLKHHRAETLPEKLDTAASPAANLVSAQHILNLMDAHEEEILLLDLRVITQYARSHITGALNLCVPTTLLKRPSYNVARLADTFKDGEQKDKFERWQSCKCIVVYDQSSSQMQEAAMCANILKKFSSEGWTGDSYIIKGGFVDFAKKFPSKVASGGGPAAIPSLPSLTLNTKDNALAPVIGGCPMPLTKNAANPFFGNIRQNMDLIGGVGQMSIKHPKTTKEEQEYDIPQWLKVASSEEDNGKKVSEKFLHIEKREQKRMQEALSGHVTYGTPGPMAHSRVQIAGIEKGSKNRYNNIWPYEHSRVKLEEVSAEGCDYVNANYLSTAESKKRYITTQAPIPATFTDFWNMVWQSDARAVVMLTTEVEGGQVKAHNYWSERHYGPIRLNFLSEHRASLELSKIKRHRSRPSLGGRRSTTGSSYLSSRQIGDSSDPSANKIESNGDTDAPHITVRKFTLSHENHPFERMREITQLQYPNWPDFGAPAHPAHLLGLVEQCAAVVRASRANSFRDNMDADDDEPARPVLVHCSAGCGRTGTFCTVDTVIDLLKQQKRARAARGPADAKKVKSPTPMDIDVTNGTQGGNAAAGGGMDFFTEGKSGDDDQLKHDGADDWLYRDDIDLIERIVEEFRLQRVSMVQSLRQYCLTYEAVLEWVIGQQEEDAVEA